MGALAAICTCLEICFLAVLDPVARDAVMDDLMVAHRHALHEARVALACCPGRSAFVQRYLAREVERWEAELVRLEGLVGKVEAIRL